MYKYLLLVFLFSGCFSPKATHEQIALCVQTCKSANLVMQDFDREAIDETFYCYCEKIFHINKEANNVSEFPAK